MAQFDLANFNRFILNTENDADSPDNEELMQQYMYNIVGLLILMLDTGISGTATADPTNVANSVFTDAAAVWTDDLHNGRTILITNGTGKGLFYKINDTDDAGNTLTINDNLYTDGIRNGDGYKILYDLIENLDGHDHDGVNSASLGLATIDQTMLHTDQGSVNGGGNHTLPGGEYGFYPRVYQVGGGTFDVQIAIGSAAAAYVTNICITQAGCTAYAQQRYVTASGEVFWIFILRDKVTKNIISMYQAPDHPCFGNGGKPLLVSHPFGNYDETKHEIIVINPTDEEVQEMREKTIQPEDKPDKDLLEVIKEDYEIDEGSKPKWPTKEVTVGLPPDWDEAWRKDKAVKPIKKRIPKMDHLLCKSLKRKKK